MIGSYTAPWTPGAPLHLESERFVLRSLGPVDVTDDYLGWLSDAEVTRFLHSGGRRRSKADVEAYVARHDNKTAFHLGIFAKDGGGHIGNYSFSCDLVHRVGQINVMVGDRGWWKKRVVGETRAAILDFLFGPMDMLKVIGTPYARNVAAVYNYQSQRFKIEGVLRDHRLLSDGTRSDVICFAMFRADWLARGRADQATSA